MSPSHRIVLTVPPKYCYSPLLPPVSLSTHLRSSELNGYRFKSSRLTPLMQSEPLHQWEKLQYTIISPFKTLGLAYNCNN